MQPCLHIKETREVAANSATGRMSNLQFKVDNRYLELNEDYISRLRIRRVKGKPSLVIYRYIVQKAMELLKTFDILR